MQRIWLQSDGEKLRTLRESTGLNPVELARSVTLTPAHIRQLEEGGDSMFYSPAIKLNVGRRLLKKLGSDLDDIAIAAPEPEVQVCAPSAAVPPPIRIEPAPQAVAERVSQAPSGDRPRPPPPDAPAVDTPLSVDRLQTAAVRHPLARWFPAVAAVAAVAMVAVVLYQLVRPWPTPVRPAPQMARVQALPAAEPTAPPPQANDTPNASEPPAKVSALASTPTPTPTVALSPEPANPSVQASTPVREAATATHCATPPTDAVALQPPTSTKPANYVHLVATQETVLCVVDGASRATKVHLKPGDARSIYGAAPWRIHSPMLAAVDVYFQGHRMTGAIGTATNVVFTEHAVNALN